MNIVGNKIVRNQDLHRLVLVSKKDTGECKYRWLMVEFQMVCLQAVVLQAVVLQAAVLQVAELQVAGPQVVAHPLALLALPYTELPAAKQHFENAFSF